MAVVLKLLLLDLPRLPPDLLHEGREVTLDGTQDRGHQREVHHCPRVVIHCHLDVCRYKAIGHRKEETPTSKLCANMPKEFGSYLRYIKVLLATSLSHSLAQTLSFTETPDYNYLAGLFRHCLIRNQ